jgi:DNA-binding Lrp family transcriptional regulator
MLNMTSIDALDARIILALDDDPDATILALSRALGIARNTVHARLRHLAEDGALRPFSQRLDLRALGYELVAFMSLWVSQTDPGILAGLLGVPEVISAHYTTGDADILAQAVARNTRDLHRITKAILAVDGVVRTSTAISLDEVIPYRPHALLRVAADSWRRPARSEVRP